MVDVVIFACLNFHELWDFSKSLKLKLKPRDYYQIYSK